MTTVDQTAPRAKRTIPGFAQLQRVGRSLMLPIASLPAAALLLRLGQPDMLGADGLGKNADWLVPVAQVLAAAGGALLDNLPILFAIGVAIGYARKSDGSTGLAAIIGYLVFTGVTKAMSPYILGKPDAVVPADVLTGVDPAALAAAQDGDYTALVQAGVAAGAGAPTQVLINYGVLGGIVIGLTAALLYQKYYRIKLPAYLAFFGGRRFVPIITAGVSVLIAVVASFVYPAFDAAFTAVGDWVTGSAVVGGFVFGTLNRLLVPFGLHHLLNSMPWFQFGDFTNAAGNVVHGDIPRFLAGDPTAGMFQAGFFPIMMFALPAAALAFVHTAKPQNRKVIAGIMGSAALVAFVTGVTEPLEFAFVYVAYPLYAIHAVLTGASLAIVNALEMRSGFGFSAGAIDFLLNWNIAENPVGIIAVGLVFAVIYYFLFRFVITKWNLKTPGREDDGVDTAALVADDASGGAASGGAATRGAGRTTSGGDTA
ncbi:PTS transporter subunit EIIC [Flavimobilis sp. GY10621]|uniref:PTS transporter subunit EIIC n=1 Tax=Flavimobilis rhizosphaerae TaxID=2775421 RepID=A0ABR9DMW6_9MICO|nr:PTS transporter subunit EIIC [Flavimobilis rhizosphaerae]MBD9698264.1 PTS transporter subunit EIIC [Flavimobilis rhizosphaerae]